MASEAPPVLSTPADHVFEDHTSPVKFGNSTRLSDDEIYVQYEIKRTVSEIRAGRWRRVALQFPDEMLVDAPRVFERLRDGLKLARRRGDVVPAVEPASDGDHVTNGDATLQLGRQDGKLENAAHATDQEQPEESLCILADTSYGACCVDEVAAEHVDADVVVHYGRSCLSPTARLPVIYVFTTKPLDIKQAVASFQETYQNRDEKVCLMADIPYSSHVPELHEALIAEGYTSVFETAVVHDPASPLPNRTVPEQVRADIEQLQKFSVFHVSTPPTSLLLILSSRVKSVYILPVEKTSTHSGPAPALQTSTAQILRRRYALITGLSTVSVFGILINTLSVKNYLQALTHVQKLIKDAGKKSYTFVVGKVNAAKVANFSEIGGWVVIGCWESSLIESQEFYRPIITPFELEVALTDDRERVWSGEWVGDFSSLLGRERKGISDGKIERHDRDRDSAETNAESGNWDEQESDDEPPEFDLRTGRYVSQSRPMGRPNNATNNTSSGAQASQSLIKRANGDLAQIGGAVSPAAEYLRSQRTWQGLGSDYEIAYERDDEGKIRGAAMEQGRSGIAKGYSVGEEASEH